MLSPKKTKFRKQFKGRIHGNAKGSYSLNYGSFGLKASWFESQKKNRLGIGIHDQCPYVRRRIFGRNRKVLHRAQESVLEAGTGKDHR